MPNLVTEIDLVLLIVSVLAFVYLVVSAYKTSRLPLLSVAVGWLFLGVYALFRILGQQYLAEIFLYFFVLGIALYIVLIVRDSYPLEMDWFALYVLIPLPHILYRILEVLHFHFHLGIGGIASDSGVALLISAFILYRVFRQFWLPISVLPISVFLLFYKLLQGTTFGFALLLLGAISFSITTIKLGKSKLFKGGTVPDIQVSGLVTIDSSELKGILQRYANAPLLLVTRNYEPNYPKMWSVLWVSMIHLDAKNVVPPTALERLGHLIVRYLAEAKKERSRGIVVMDCLDYLMLYHDEQVVLKFLSDLRDYAIVYEGTIFVAVDRNSLSKRTLRFLESLSADIT